MSDGLHKTFFISYSDKKSRWQIGIPQAFKYEHGELFILLFLEIENNELILEWVRADLCKCLKIICADIVCDIMSRDEVTTEDLQVIKDFRWMYTQEVIK